MSKKMKRFQEKVAGDRQKIKYSYNRKPQEENQSYKTG